jgi:simple sugar transport system permease protein
MSHVLAAMFTTTFVLHTLYIAIPFVLGALGACVTERSGIVDLAVEAKLLFGALAAAMVAYHTGSMAAGMVAGAAAGAAVGLIQAGCAVGLRADHVITGVALNLVAYAGTRYLLQISYGQSSSSPNFDGIGDAVGTNPIFWITLIATAAVPWWFVRTRAGLRVRAAGDRPDALRAAGASVLRARLLAAGIGGALAGLGGAEISLSVNGFSASMSSGKGYMALAAVILANWRPGRAALACLLFAVMDELNTQLQMYDTWVPRELAPLLPYLVTLAVLAGIGGGRRPPAALGKTEA